MAGRGRGRGRGFTFNIEQLGLSRSDVLAKPNYQQPPQPYPVSYGSHFAYSERNRILYAR